MVEVGVTDAVRANRATDLKVAAGHIKLTAVVDASARVEDCKSHDKHRRFDSKREGFHGSVTGKEFSADNEGCRCSAITQGLNSQVLNLVAEGAVFGLQDFGGESLAVLGGEEAVHDQLRQ